MVGNRMGFALRRCLGIAVALSLFASSAAFAAWEWNFQPPATPVAQDIFYDSIHHAAASGRPS